MVYLLILLLVVALAAGIRHLIRSRPVFVVRISAGLPRVDRGTVTRGFLEEVRATCGRHGVDRGAVRGVKRGDKIALTFSGSMPEPCRQQLRNLWVLSGWSAGPRPNRR